MAIQTIGVIGAGQMGNGIAHVMALAEYNVLMTDISQDALDAAMQLIYLRHCLWFRPIIVHR